MKASINNEDGHEDFEAMSDDELKAYLNEAIAELEALQQPKSCDGCWHGKTTINSVICGKNGTYKEADDYCKYYNPKEQ